MTTRNRAVRGLFIASGVLLASGLSSAQVTGGTIHNGELVGDPTSLFAGALPYPASPIGNPFWEPNHPDFGFVERQAMLGKALFWDEQLSSDSTMACGTCHAMVAGGTDGRVGAFAPNHKLGSPGMFPQNDVEAHFFEGLNGVPLGSPAAPAVNELKRVTELTAPSMINSVFFNKLFWQHRAGPEFQVTNAGGGALPGFLDFAAPEALAAMPPVSPIEMGHDDIAWSSGKIQEKLRKADVLRLARPISIPADIQWLYLKSYHDVFTDLYGAHPSGNPITRERVAMSIAHYLRTLISDQAPVLVPGALTNAQRKAMRRLQTNGCFNCHSSSGNPQPVASGGFVDKFDGLFSDGRLHSIGLPPPGNQAVDPVTGVLGTAFMKTPSFLNMGLRNRFFHSGQITDLPTLLSFYNQELPTQPQNVFFPPLGPQEKAAMLSLWMDGFTDPRVANATFPFDRPDLHSERLTQMGALENRFGPGISGAFGLPQIISSPPATDGEPWFKAGLANARPGASSMFGLSLNTGGGPAGLTIGSGINWSAAIPVQPDRMGTWFEANMPLLGLTGFLGTTVYGQWIVFDGTSPNNYSATRAARFLIQ